MRYNTAVAKNVTIQHKSGTSFKIAADASGIMTTLASTSHEAPVIATGNILIEGKATQNPTTVTLPIYDVLENEITLQEVNRLKDVLGDTIETITIEDQYVTRILTGITNTSKITCHSFGGTSTTANEFSCNDYRINPK